jgi:predicted XRE-type DNA-binding protein
MPVGNRFNEEALARAAEGPNAHKAELVRFLRRYQEMNGLTLAEMGEAGGVAWVTLSRLFGGNLAEVSTDKLLRIFATLGVHIDIRVDLSPPEDRTGRVEVRGVGATVQSGEALPAAGENDGPNGS